MSELTITDYTDPACPFAWSAEPSRWRLRWLYGDQLRWQLRMVGLSDTPRQPSDGGFTPERQAWAFGRLADRYGMPIDTAERPRVSASMPACRAVVAARLNAPEREAALLRSLRVLHFSGRLLDDPDMIAAAATRAGIDPAELERWIAEPETEELLAEDLRAARTPTPAALALPQKLARTDDGWRYTCPSYEVVRDRDGAGLSAPGMQPTLAYEVVIANLAPELERRENPADVAEALAWAREPLASVEVAEVCGLELDDAREQLGRVATEEHIGNDGLWHLEKVAA